MADGWGDSFVVHGWVNEAMGDKWVVSEYVGR